MKTTNTVEYNTKAHDSISATYEHLHGEIFNPIEQARLHRQLAKAIQYIQTSSFPKEVLDYGCGSGNVTTHLLDLGTSVTAADISDNFLNLIKEKHSVADNLKVLKINGNNLSNIEDNRFDMVATYSVLHHIPDYLNIISEMARVTRPGGVLYFDHEYSESYWNKTKEYEEFMRALPKAKKNWKRFFKPLNYVNKVRRIVDPRYEPEGDIHVWSDDHIEWSKVENVLVQEDCKVVLKEDYLLYKRGYPEELYEKYKTKCADMCMMVARKE